jgi:hypothetical protein
MTTTTPGDTTSRDRMPARTQGPGRVISIVGIVLGALGLIFGILLGIPGLICGVIGAAKGNRLGIWAIVVSIVCTAAGIAIGLALIGGR